MNIRFSGVQIYHDSYGNLSEYKQNELNKAVDIFKVINPQYAPHITKRRYGQDAITIHTNNHRQTDQALKTFLIEKADFKPEHVKIVHDSD
jgi:hypothetical protein